MKTTETTKRCRDCEKMLPLSKFYCRERDANGEPHYFQSYCKECSKQRSRVRNGVKRRGQPYGKRKKGMSPEARAERHRVLDRRRRRRIRRERERDRIEDNRRARAEGAALRERLSKEHRAELAAIRADFALVREQRMATASPERTYRYACKVAAERWREPGEDEYSAFPSQLVSPEPFAAWISARFESPELAGAAIGIHPRKVRALVTGEQRSVRLTVLDRAFTNYGRPDLLNDLYPLESA